MNNSYMKHPLIIGIFMFLGLLIYDSISYKYYLANIKGNHIDVVKLYPRRNVKLCMISSIFTSILLFLSTESLPDLFDNNDEELSTQVDF